jgi:SUMO ligase MMS21 Smc5/6 complex component
VRGRIWAPDERIVAQAAKYMRALKSTAEAQGLKGARLMIITGQPNEELAEQVQLHAAKIGVKCEWHLYRVRFELKKVQASPGPVA